MKKKLTLLLATALAGTMTLTALAPAAYADNRGGPRMMGERGEMHEQMGRRAGGAGGAGNLIALACSEDGAPRLELILNRVAERIDLTDQQQPLFDAFRTSALTAQTSFADNCVVPTRDGTPDAIELIKLRQTNMAARMTAVEEVLPSLETFYDSLTDDQKQQLRPDGRGRQFSDFDGDDDDRRGNGRKGMGPRHS